MRRALMLARQAEIEQAVADGTAAFNLNASQKTIAFNNNASSKTTDFNTNATNKTNAFNQNATDKTDAFNLNAGNKTTDFNDNYTVKKALIDAEVATASGYAADAKQWAIGDPSEPSGGSSKYWADTAAATLANKQDKLTVGAGIDITSNVISNTGVRSVATGASNGTISVNTNGTAAEVSVYGLGSAAYTASTAYATSAQGGLADTAVQPGDVATVATTGSYSDLLNKPTIPAAQVNSDWNANSGVAEILNKPTIPTVDQTYSSSSANAQSGVAVASAISTMLSTLYPVGSIYIGTQSTCPLATLISGSTWTIVATDKALWGGDGTNADTTIAAGLPNIKANFDYTVSSTAPTGATNNVARADGFVAVKQYEGYETDFDASRSSSIYGSSTTVQPPAYRVNVWKRTA